MRILLTMILLTAATIAFSQPVSHHNIVSVSRNASKTTKTTALVFDPALKPFYHGVASGDPKTDGFVIWTRVTPDSPTVQITINGTWQVATDTGFTQIIANGNFAADTARDYTVKVAVSGLNAGTTYYYKFQALNANSLVGRAKTLPTGNVTNLKFAIVSCSNYEGGYFNAYRKIADRNDLDAVLHLGDYIYEYGQGTYGINLPGRNNEPATEILVLSDYRTRYSLYRLDKDLIRLHQQHTFINIWDDHESANDSYMDGAENHQPNEGSWTDRKAVSKRVYFEWMPIRDNPNDTIYRKINYGNLCDVVMLDTRLEGRQQPPVNFDDPDPIANPRRIMSDNQMNWLIGNLKSNQTKWKVIGNQILYSVFNVGFAGGYADGVPNPTDLDSIRAAENLFIDNWESYPRQRHRLLDSIKNGLNNVVFVSGDSHCSWAFDIPDTAVVYPNPAMFNLPTPKAYNSSTKSGYNATTQQGSWAVEYGTPSISSPNFDELVGQTVANTFEGFMNNPVQLIPGGPVYNPHLRYVDLDRHGFFILDVKDDSVHADYYYVSRIDTPSAVLNTGAAMKTLSNSNKVNSATAPAPPKTAQDIPTPINPPGLTNVPNQSKAPILFSLYPNPAQSELYVHIGLQEATKMDVQIIGMDGKLVATLLAGQSFNSGVYNLRFNLDAVNANGNYLLVFKSNTFKKTYHLQILR